MGGSKAFTMLRLEDHADCATLVHEAVCAAGSCFAGNHRPSVRLEAFSPIVACDGAQCAPKPTVDCVGDETNCAIGQ